MQPSPRALRERTRIQVQADFRRQFAHRQSPVSHPHIRYRTRRGCKAIMEIAMMALLLTTIRVKNSPKWIRREILFVHIYVKIRHASVISRTIATGDDTKSASQYGTQACFAIDSD